MASKRSKEKIVNSQMKLTQFSEYVISNFVSSIFRKSNSSVFRKSNSSLLRKSHEFCRVNQQNLCKDVQSKKEVLYVVQSKRAQV